jgi:peptidoglycan/LPS O-acetylase OafA/YrhL
LTVSVPISGALSTGRANNFNLMRMAAASAVLISHAYPLARGPQAVEPLAGTIGMSLGTLAVITFFAISGYFIFQSLDRSQTILDFFVARILRIYPGLIVAVTLAALVLGPIVTKLKTGIYFGHIDTYVYIPRNLSLFCLQYDLPGVFTDNPLRGAVNGSLWTLFYEAGCYGMVACVGISGFALNGRRFGCFLTLCALSYASIFWLDYHYKILSYSQFLRDSYTFVPPFIIGMSIYYFRGKLPLKFSLASAGMIVTIFSYGRPWFREVFVISWSYSLFYMGFLRSTALLIYNRIGDYSYGLYIYAFPVEQVGAALFKESTPVELIVFSFPATLLLAVLSWHLLEKRALLLRATASEWARQKTRFMLRARTGRVREVPGNVG